MGSEQAACSVSSAEMTHPDHGHLLEQEIPCSSLSQTITAEQHAQLCCEYWLCNAGVLPQQSTCQMQTVTGEFLLKTSTGRAMCKKKKIKKKYSKTEKHF